MSEIKNLFRTKIPINALTEYKSFRASDGYPLFYRNYAATSRTLLIAYHGIASSSKYLVNFAKMISDAGLAAVVTPDFRGHHRSQLQSHLSDPQRLNLDLQNLVEHLQLAAYARGEQQYSEIVLCGHSLGAGFVLRSLEANSHPLITKFVLLAPSFGDIVKNHKPLYERFIRTEKDWTLVNLPLLLQSGEELLKYHKSFFEAALPSLHFQKNLALNKNIEKYLVIMGGNDELFEPRSLVEIFSTDPRAQIEVLEGLDHMNLVINKSQLAHLLKPIEALLRQKI